jgi:hypothetical protein
VFNSSITLPSGLRELHLGTSFSLPPYDTAFPASLQRISVPENYGSNFDESTNASFAEKLVQCGAILVRVRMTEETASKLAVALDAERQEQKKEKKNQRQKEKKRKRATQKEKGDGKRQKELESKMSCINIKD